VQRQPNQPMPAQPQAASRRPRRHNLQVSGSKRLTRLQPDA